MIRYILHKWDAESRTVYTPDYDSPDRSTDRPKAKPLYDRNPISLIADNMSATDGFSVAITAGTPAQIIEDRRRLFKLYAASRDVMEQMLSLEAEHRHGDHYDDWMERYQVESYFSIRVGLFLSGFDYCPYCAMVTDHKDDCPHGKVPDQLADPVSVDINGSEIEVAVNLTRFAETYGYLVDLTEAPGLLAWQRGRLTDLLALLEYLRGESDENPTKEWFE